MWLIAEYDPVTLFSLKMSAATASGGKTLLAPTPYALKLALIDAACRNFGLASAKDAWPQIAGLQIALRPAEQAVVTHLFQKVLRPRRNPAQKGDPDEGYFQRTIAYREYVQLVGTMMLAFGKEDRLPAWLADLLVQINYLGKRGGFVQLLASPQERAELPEGFTSLTQEANSFPVDGTLQLMDDCTPGLSFQKVDIYSAEKLKLDKDRLFRRVVLPYRLARSSKSFSHYERF
jgi:hypothetical protein